MNRKKCDDDPENKYLDDLIIKLENINNTNDNKSGCYDWNMFLIIVLLIIIIVIIFLFVVLISIMSINMCGSKASSGGQNCHLKNMKLSIGSNKAT